MVYNINYNIASIIFLTVFWIFLTIGYSSESNANRCFRLLTLSVIIAAILDTVTAVTISYSTQVSVGINYVLNILFFISEAFVCSVFLAYIRFLETPDGRRRIPDLIIEIELGIYSLMVVSSPVSHIIFYFDEAQAYTHGEAYSLVGFLPVICMAYAVARMLAFHNRFSKKQILSVILFIVIGQVGALIQFVLMNHILISFFSYSVALIVLFFSYETPDYQRLIQTARQLEDSRKELVSARVAAENATAMIHELMKTGSWTLHLNDKAEIISVESSSEFRYLLNGNSDMNIPDYQLWTDALHPDDRDRVNEALVRGARGDNTYDEVFRLKDKTGTYRWYRGTGELTSDENGNKSLRGVIQDVHEDKIKEILIEEKLTALEDLKKSEEALKEALDEAQRANRAKSDFLSNMSHDIRTPMNAVIGFTELAIDNIDDAAVVKGYLEKIQTSGNHLLMLINDILDMSKIESGNITIENTRCDLRELIASIEKIVDGDARNRKVNFNCEIENMSDSIVMCDKLRVNQILLNCIGNSVKFTPPGGYVELRVQKLNSDDPDRADFSFIIADTGIGMSKEFLERIFEPFERERTSTVSRIQGTGLGMTITKNLVEMMNGTIYVESREGEGTTYTINLPFDIIHEHGQDENDQSFEGISIEEMGRFLEGRHMLLVDDNATNRLLAQGIFKSRGITADEAVNGEEAVEIIKNAAFGEYDMILMDVQMPVMDGLMAADMIRALEDPELSELPILAMTANAFAEDRDECMAHGMTDYIAKPYKPNELIRKLYRCLKRRSA